MSNYPNQNRGDAYALPADEMGGFYPAAMAAAAERKAFIQKTYLHVAGALVLFAGALAGLVTFVPDEIMLSVFGRGSLGMLAILGAFIAASYLSGRLASPDQALPMQYLGLGLYIALEAFIFWPLIWIVGHKFGDYNIVYQAALLTAVLAAGLTTSVFVTGKDFSFLGPIISIGCWAALAIILVAVFFPAWITIGFWFSAAMVGLMCAAILYGASNVLHHYPTNAYVAAALYIFSAIVTLFYWVIRLLMSSRN